MVADAQGILPWVAGEEVEIDEGEGAKARRDPKIDKEPVVTRVLMYSEALGGFKGVTATTYDDRNKSEKGDRDVPF
jgi:hypothetical protein